jgi:hypothetical protein
MGNLDLYERYAQPPENALKAFNNGKFKGTDINPMWRIKALTEAFGPCGIGWYTEIVNQWREDTADGTATVYCHIHLYVKADGEWSKPITGVGGNTLHRKTQGGTSTTDEAYKMAYTDALGISCKALGIGADIWWKEARSKYTADDVTDSQPLQNKPTVNPQNKPTVKKKETVAVKYDHKPELNALMQKLNTDINGFAKMYSALIDGGVLPNMKSSDMGRDDWQRVFRAVEQNFSPSEGAA